MDISDGLFLQVDVDDQGDVSSYVSRLIRVESFEGAGKEWLLFLFSSSFHASPFILGGHI